MAAKITLETWRRPEGWRWDVQANFTGDDMWGSCSLAGRAGTLRAANHALDTVSRAICSLCPEGEEATVSYRGHAAPPEPTMPPATLEEQLTVAPPLVREPVVGIGSGHPWRNSDGGEG